MGTMTAEKLAAGQEVVLVRRNRFSSDTPEIRASGRVTSVARRFAVADIAGSRAYEFDMATGYERGDTNGNGLCIMTRERYDLDCRYAEAIATLKEAGLEPRLGRRIDAALAIALADLARSFDPDTSTPKEQQS